MNRKDELVKLIGEESYDLVKEVVDEVIFLEEKLQKLKQYPFIQVHPLDDTKQRATPAAKQYKEFLQQYINCIKMIESIIYKDKRLEGEEVEDSPLRKWYKKHESTSD